MAAFSMPKMKRLSTSFMENSMKEVALTGTSFTPEEVYEDGYILRVVFTEKENKNKPLGNGEGSCQYRQLPFLDFHMHIDML